MVLIFSQESDHSTNEVVKWLNHYRVPFIRINKLTQLYEKLIFDNQRFCFSSENSFQINLLKKSVSSVWFRREPDFEMVGDSFDQVIDASISFSYYYELKVIRDLIIDGLKDKYWLNHPKKSSVNKILILQNAINLGLLIPPTTIITNKKDLIAFKKKHREIITKPLYEVLRIKDKFDNRYMNRTNIVTNDLIKSLNDEFPPSLFQKKINKSFEVRTVFLEDQFYSMAIFSQKNEHSKIDFRHYNKGIPNRYSAFKLPINIEKKIKKLMKNQGLNFGSIDFIIDQEDDIYFLEVNPVGQFGMTSTPNNYQIEQKVAIILKNKYDEFTNKIF